MFSSLRVCTVHFGWKMKLKARESVCTMHTAFASSHIDVCLFAFILPYRIGGEQHCAMNKVQFSSKVQEVKENMRRASDGRCLGDLKWCTRRCWPILDPLLFRASGGVDRFWPLLFGQSLRLLSVSALTIICHSCRGENRNANSNQLEDIACAPFAASSTLSTLQSECKVCNWKKMNRSKLGLFLLFPGIFQNECFVPVRHFRFWSVALTLHWSKNFWFHHI